MQCPECETDIADTAKYCPNCGFEVAHLPDDTPAEQAENRGSVPPNTETSENARAPPDDTPQSADSSNPFQQNTDSSDGDAWTDAEPRDASNHDQSNTATGGQPTTPDRDTTQQTDQTENHRNAQRDRPSEQTPPGDGGDASRRSATEPHAGNQSPRQAQDQPPQNQRPPRQSTQGRRQRNDQHSNAHPQPGQTAAGQPTATQTGRQPPAQQAQTQTGTGFSIPYIRGAIAGGIAAAATYALVFGLYAYELSTKTNGFPIEDGLTKSVQQYEVAGWLFYSAHNVKLSLTGQLYGNPVSSTGLDSANMLNTIYGAFQLSDTSMITQTQVFMLDLFFGGREAMVESFTTQAGATGQIASLTVPKLAYMAAPAIVLAVAGYALAKRVGAGRRLTAGQRALAGASTAIGYAAVLAAGAVVVFSVTATTGGSTGEMATNFTMKPVLNTAVMMGVAYPAIAGGVGGLLAK